MKRRKRRSASQWQQIIANWQNSGLSVSAFCRDNKLPTSAFYRWKMKIRQEEAQDQASFVQVAWPSTREATRELTLMLPTGTVLGFPETASKRALVSVLAALKEVGL